MSILIRPACSEDFGQVVQIANETLEDMAVALPHMYKTVEHSISREEYLEKLNSPEGFIYVAATADGESGDVVGFLIGDLRQAPDHEACVPLRYGYVSYFGVTNSWQRGGVGTRLFDACLAEVKARGGQSLMLKVFEYNEKAIRFYERYRMKTLHKIMELPL